MALTKKKTVKQQDDFEFGGENEMGVFPHTLTVMNQNKHSSHRAK